MTTATAPVTTSYLVEEYERDGWGPSDDLRRAGPFATLLEARRAVRDLLGVKALRPERRWWPMDPNFVEAYHSLTRSQPRSDGCGGYSIVKVRS